MTITRRSALAALATASGTALIPGCRTTQSVPLQAQVFRHGVASGDPDSDSIVIWTRISGAQRATQVSWVVSTDPEFQLIAGRGEALTGPDSDFTVKVVVGGLEPGTRYFYRFETMGEMSPAGRSRTLPVGAVEKLGVALASCSNFAFGHFTAYQAIADDPEIDIVLHTGDYIYEYGAGEWGDETATALGRRHDPPHEIVTLDDYRRRFAQYRTDPGAQAMHAAHPFVACWDDHETTNNPWAGGAQNHQPDTEGEWLQRRSAALQAYYEWMPIREPGPGRTREEFWRSYSFGDLATLVTLETRHTARGEQLDYKAHYESLQSDAQRNLFMAEIIGDPSRRMISEGMEEELRRAFATSKALGQPWRMIGNASPMARMLVPDIAAHGIGTAEAPEGELPGQGPNLFWKARWNLPFYTDTWDGYPVARQNFYQLCQDAGVRDLLVLTGDSHSFWANQLFDDHGVSMGLEIGTAGISSPGDFVETGWKGDAPSRLDRIFETALPEVRWTDNLHQGYVRTVLTRDMARVDFIAVETVLLPTAKARIIRSETIASRAGVLSYL